MQLFKTIVERVWEKLYIAGVVLGVLLPSSPLNMPLTFRDSGVFLYVGWRILNGELPYRDIWDHKPPIIFYVNALGLALGNGSRWGVWFLEFIALFLAAFIGFHLIKRIFGTHPAILSTFLWLFILVFLLQGGNLTTEYALPLQFAALWLVQTAEKSSYPYRHWFLVGLLGGVAFFTKQTAIGIWIAIVLYLTIGRLMSGQINKWFKELLFICVGGLAICISWVVFFSIQGAFAQFWSAAFAFNFTYSSSNADITSRLNSIVNGLAPLKIAWLLQFSIIGSLIGILLVFYKKGTLPEGNSLILIGLIDLPIELFFIGFSGHSFPHYYMTLLPIFSLFAGAMAWGILSSLPFWKANVTVKFLCLLSIMGIFLWSPIYKSYKGQVSLLSYAKNPTMIRYIKRNTLSNDEVLLWGAESTLNYFTQRNSPSRFVYQFPLYTQGYANEQLISEFLRDILINCPRLIIDTHNPDTPIYNFPIQTQAIKDDIALVQSRYLDAENVGDWTIYKYNGNVCHP